jgi:anti-anti-sigma factor
LTAARAIAGVGKPVLVPEPKVIEPPSELDVASVNTFRRALQDAPEGVIVDLSHVEFIDSSGLGAIMEARERARVEGAPFAVVAPRGTAAAVLFTLSGLRSRLSIFDSLSSARTDVAG